MRESGYWWISREDIVVVPIREKQFNFGREVGDGVEEINFRIIQEVKFSEFSNDVDT